ncbi:MAG: adenosine deaminase [Anaerolineae bacterium]|nr:MAG: adenosine deaminase [Anaerolineae bacterium]
MNQLPGTWSESMTLTRDLHGFLQGLPKIDLHRHLEGSLRLETVVGLARENGVSLPSYDIERLRPLVQVTDDPPDFDRYLGKFHILRRIYSTPQVIERLAYETVADAAADNVRYLELRFSPSAQAAAHGFSFSDTTDWVIAGVQRAQRDFDITVRLIIALVRHDPFEWAEEITEIAIARQANGVVGFDLAGQAEKYPAAPFVRLFKRAKAAGLNITVHAGEATGPTAVTEAVTVLGAQRIGHGIRAIEDSQVCQQLRNEGITLEVCPTSNIHTGAVQSFWRHPLKDLHHLGVPVTINTDNTSVSNTTLTDEYLMAMLGIGIKLTELREMLMNAVEAAFLPDDEKETLRTWFHQELWTWP